MGRPLGIDFSWILVDLGNQDGAKLGGKVDKKSIQKGIQKQLRKSRRLGRLWAASWPPPGSILASKIEENR